MKDHIFIQVRPMDALIIFDLKQLIRVNLFDNVINLRLKNEPLLLSLQFKDHQHAFENFTVISKAINDYL